MTSSNAQRPAGNMATAGRGSRFSNLTMGNGADKPTQQLASTLTSASGWGSGTGIWGTGAIGAFGKQRETAVSKDSSDGFPKPPSGSSALAATSEAEPSWLNRTTWNNTESNQARNVSGNTSPNRSRIEAQMHDPNGNTGFYSTAQPPIQPAIGQRPQVRSKAGAASESAAGPFGLSPFAGDYMTENEDPGSFGPIKFGSETPVLNGYAAPKRPSQDVTFQSLSSVAPRDPGMPTSSHSETDAHIHPNSFGDLAYGGHSHSQRPSMSFSQPGRGFSNGIEQLGRDDIQGKFASMTLGDGPGGSSNGLGAYGNGASQTQFNPQSQSWGPPTQSYGLEYQKDLYPNPPGYEKRGSIPDRGSPAGSTYQRALSSPKSYTGTPQPGGDPWSRPASRDPRNGPELERRGVASQQFHQPAGYFSPPYFGYQAYPPHLYPFAGGFRPQIPIAPGYELPLGYLQNQPPIRPAKDQDPARGMRSALLDEFRATPKPNKRFELKHIYGHIVEFSGDQHGSRFIQEKLESANSDEKDQVFREIEPNALQLMRDVFGNYVIQKFFEHGNQVQKKVLASAMKGKVIDLSLQMYACRVVQKALEHILVEQQAELVKELEADILRVVKDQNGNHVVQKIVELVPRQHLDFIMSCLKGRVSELSSHTYGCRVIQRILEHGSEADKAAIMQELHQCAHMLITDQYGNYVTQHVIAHGKPEDSSKIIEIVTAEILLFSKHKFASNVVEKCIECGSPEELSRIREGLSEPGDELNSPMPLMIKDQYGNYVIQKLLSQLTGSERDAYTEVIRPHVAMLKKANTSQRQVTAIERLINQPTPTSTATPQSPAMPADEGSAIPTPGLTTGHNSPSSSPPSTNDGVLGEAAGVAVEHASAKLSKAGTTSIH